MDYKGYNVQAMGTYAMYEIKAKGQGFVPESLIGGFMTRADAFKQIDMYLASLIKGKRKNEQTKDGSTG